MSKTIDNISLEIALILSTIILLAVLVLPYFYLKYINRMEKENCKCSKIIDRHGVLIYSIFIYVSLILLVFFIARAPEKKVKRYIHNPTTTMMSASISFLGAYFLLRYSIQMRQSKDCECAQGWELQAMKFHSYLEFTLVFLALFNIIGVMLGHKDLMKSLGEKVEKL